MPPECGRPAGSPPQVLDSLGEAAAVRRPRRGACGAPWGGGLLRSALLVLVLTAGCVPSSYQTLGVIRGEGPALNFSVLPFVERGTLAAGLRPLTAFLSARLDRRVALRLVPNYAELDRLVDQSRVDLGWLAPRPPGPGEALVPVAEAVVPGQPVYRGLLVARRGAGMSGLADLRGRSLGFVDRASKSGFLMPLRLLEEAGLDPLRDLATVSYAGNHERALEGLEAGRFDAVAVTELLFRDPAAARRLETDLVVLGRTGPIAPDPIVARAGLGDELLGRLRTALLEAGSDPEGRTMLASLAASLGIQSFRAPPPGAP